MGGRAAWIFGGCGQGKVEFRFSKVGGRVEGDFGGWVEGWEQFRVLGLIFDFRRSVAGSGGVSKVRRLGDCSHSTSFTANPRSIPPLRRPSPVQYGSILNDASARRARSNLSMESISNFAISKAAGRGDGNFECEWRGRWEFRRMGEGMSGISIFGC